MKNILILSFSSLQHDARVSRQIDFLKGSYKITVVAFDGLPDSEVELIKVQRPRLSLARKAFLSFFLGMRLHKTAYQLLHGHPEIVSLLSARKFDLIIANDIESLPLAFAINPRAKVLFDAHEYAPRHFEDKLSWRIFFQPLNIYLCKKFIPRTAAMTTVSIGLAREYEKQFHVKPDVITNAAWSHPISPSPTDAQQVRLIHHGGATVSRKLELMIELMQHLEERFTLDLMLIIPELASRKTKNYIEHLRTMADGDPRIRFLPALKSSELVPFLNQYDIGVFLLPPVNFNYANTLPNKLFDFIQARLGIAIGPTPEMAEIVDKYGNGVIAEDFTAKSLADKLNRLTAADIGRFKVQSSIAAAELTAEKNKANLLTLVANLVS